MKPVQATCMVDCILPHSSLHDVESQLHAATRQHNTKTSSFGQRRVLSASTPHTMLNLACIRLQSGAHGRQKTIDQDGQEDYRARKSRFNRVDYFEADQADDALVTALVWLNLRGTFMRDKRQRFRSLWRRGETLAAGCVRVRVFALPASAV